MRTRNIHLIDELKIGGAQTHLVTVLREMIRREPPSSHTVISLFGGGGIEDELRSMGIQVEALNFRPAFARRRYFEPALALQRIFREREPKLVIAHLTYGRLLGLYAAWRAGVPVRIGFEHGDFYLTSFPFRIANFLGQVFPQKIVVCSRALGDWYHKTHRVSWSKLVVLHNCVDLQRFCPGQRNDRLRQEWGVPLGRTLFCAVGTLGDGVNKRVDVCVRAVAKARARGCDIGLVVCGDGSQRPRLESLAAELSLEDAVRFLGMRRDVPAVMSACDAFCHAAPFEPFGIVCLEAMAMELPVVVPRSGGIVEVVEDGITGRVYSPLDEEALAEVMCALHAGAALRRALGQAGRHAVEERFSSTAYCDRLSALIAEIAAK